MAIVTTQAEFRSAITAAAAEIILANDITLTTLASISYTVTIKGQQPGLSLFWGNPTAASPNMLIVTAAGELTLESIILDAQNRNGTLVQVNGGTLIMNDGAIIRNVRSTSAQSGVKIGTLTSFLGGKFIMNGGHITGIDSSDSVFCSGGSVIMNNSALISENTASGVAVTKPVGGGERGSFTMTGNSRVCDNRNKQAGGGVIVYSSDVYMGAAEGDAPEIYGNRPPLGSYGGGIVLSDGSTLTMSHKAKIWGNYTDFAGGGILAQDTVITMRGEASVVDNICDGTTGGGGIRIHRESQLIMEDKSLITGNSSAGHGGGVYMQPGATLEMKGNSSIFNNKAVNGAGIYMASSATLTASASIGLDNSYPQIHSNTASGNGGGIYIDTLSRLNVTGYSCIHSNLAEKGKGIYKDGLLSVSQSLQVLDGLFFDAPIIPITRASNWMEQIKIIAEPAIDGSHIVLKSALEDAYDEIPQTASVLQSPAYTDNVPIIANQLTSLAVIVLELSGYISTPNVPLVIADKGQGYGSLDETDRAAWRIPTEFGKGYAVILNPELNQVLIVYEVYGINYCHLYDADNPNPDFYSLESEFPIVLQAPGARKGYEFAGWYNCEGQLVTEIPEGTTGDLLLIALWEKNDVYSIKYCHLYGADNPNPNFYGYKSEFPIVLQKPGERKGYEFAGWYNCEGERVTEIPEGTKGDILLVALWKEAPEPKLWLYFDGNAPCVTDIPDAISMQPGDAVSIPYGKPKRNCFCFVSWNTSPNGVGKNYAPDDKIMLEDANITLYAIWTPKCRYEGKDSSKCPGIKWHCCSYKE